MFRRRHKTKTEWTVNRGVSVSSRLSFFLANILAAFTNNLNGVVLYWVNIYLTISWNLHFLEGAYIYQENANVFQIAPNFQAFLQSGKLMWNHYRGQSSCVMCAAVKTLPKAQRTRGLSSAPNLIFQICNKLLPTRSSSSTSATVTTSTSCYLHIPGSPQSSLLNGS